MYAILSYYVEMRFNLTPMGYDVTRPEGDVVEWNISVYDCDWFWPISVTSFSSNRVCVITSYSIHYTKLYEMPRSRGGCHQCSTSPSTN